MFFFLLIYTFLYNNLVVYIKVKLKGKQIWSFLDLCQSPKDTVSYHAKARSWLQEAISIFRYLVTGASLESELLEAYNHFFWDFGYRDYGIVEGEV